MLISRELLRTKRCLDTDVENCRYVVGESVFVMDKAHLGKSWKTVQKVGLGKRGEKVKSAKTKGNVKKVSKKHGRIF